MDFWTRIAAYLINHVTVRTMYNFIRGPAAGACIKGYNEWAKYKK